MLRFGAPCTKDDPFLSFSRGNVRSTLGSVNVRFFDRTPEYGRLSGASQRRHRFQDYRRDARGAARGFCSPDQRALAYLDLDLDVSEGASGKRFLIKPAVTARMLQAAEIKDTDKVLVAGCATGYTAALVAKFAGQVTATESDPALAAKAKAILADLGLGQCDGPGRGGRRRGSGGWPL